MNPSAPFYPYRPIGSRVALARMLQCGSVDQLAQVELKADSLYYVAKRELKSDGRIRLCYDARPPLKSIQARIQCLILKKVRFPKYLMGGISDAECPRDYVRNAQRHLGARIVVNEDVSSFFPSTSTEIVFDIWHNFFRFPEDVAKSLTALTTKDGGLPQGAKTSSYLANLAFWRREPGLSDRLGALGFTYGRYVDDVGISSHADRSNRKIGAVIGAVAGMVRQSGLKLKKSKHKLMRAGVTMEVTGLNVDRRASIKPDKRARLRAMVHRCEKLAANEPASAELSQLYQKTCCMVGQLKRLHPREAALLRTRLDLIRTLIQR